MVCFDAETFTRQGAADLAVNAARNLRARLGEMSQAMGINLYAYVDSNPLRFLDAFGLSKSDQWWGYGNDKGFRDWWHKEKQYYGIEDIPNKEVCDNLYKDYQDQKARGEAKGKGSKSGKGGKNKDDELIRRIIRRGGGGGGGGARGSE